MSLHTLSIRVDMKGFLIYSNELPCAKGTTLGLQKKQAIRSIRRMKSDGKSTPRSEKKKKKYAMDSI